MDSTGSSNREDRQGQQHQQPRPDDGGHSGEGSASALAHMKTQARQRHQTGEADDAAGNRGGGGHPQ